MKRPKGKKYDGITRPPSEAYKNGWNEIFLNRVMKEEHGPNKGKVLG